MSDRDYGVNADHPESLIGCVLDNGQSAKEIMDALEECGFVIVPKEPTREMWAAGGDACVGKTSVHHDQVVAAVWQAMLAQTPR